jgi:hypothetical protein
MDEPRRLSPDEEGEISRLLERRMSIGQRIALYGFLFFILSWVIGLTWLRIKYGSRAFPPIHMPPGSDIMYTGI